MSSTDLPPQVTIRERDEKVIDCPPEIAEQLRKAAFDQTAANEFVKTRTTFDGDDEYNVVTAVIDGDKLHLSVEDVVGVVNLTPSSKLQIKPKIGWNEILEMFITVNKYNRSLEFHGVPIDDFLSDDVQIEDIFVVVAVNYLNSLQPLYRHGFIREFSTKRVDAVESRGRIDVERSAQNFALGIPKHHYVQKNINYSVPANSLIQQAGKLLLQLFQYGSGTYEHEEYFRIFSEVNEEVKRLEEMGISSSGQRLGKYRQVDSSRLPRQREYYARAIKTAKMILSSTTGQSLESGSEELTMDYIIDMDSLFEEFSQIVLEEELDALSSDILYAGLDEVAIEDEPAIYPYEDTNQAHYRPDHVLKHGGETVAVLDSKYYGESNDPSLIGDARSRMFSYAFLLDTATMAFLTPFGAPRQRELRDIEGVVDLVRPEGRFTTSQYRTAIQEYLHQVLGEYIEEGPILEDIERRDVCHSKMSSSSLNKVLTKDELLVQDNNAGLMVRQILESAIVQSDEVRARRELNRQNHYQLQQNLRKLISRHQDWDRCIPIFLSSDTDTEIDQECLPELDDADEWDGEWIRLYFLSTRENGVVEDIHTVDAAPLDWNGEL